MGHNLRAEGPTASNAWRPATRLLGLGCIAAMWAHYGVDATSALAYIPGSMTHNVVNPNENKFAFSKINQQ